MKQILYDKTTNESKSYSCLTDIARITQFSTKTLSRLRKGKIYDGLNWLILFDVKEVKNRTKIRTFKPFKSKASI